MTSRAAAANCSYDLNSLPCALVWPLWSPSHQEVGSISLPFESVSVTCQGQQRRSCGVCSKPWDALCASSYSFSAPLSPPWQPARIPYWRMRQKGQSHAIPVVLTETTLNWPIANKSPEMWMGPSEPSLNETLFLNPSLGVDCYAALLQQ